MLRWMAAVYLETEKHFRRIMGYKSLWVLLGSALRKEEEVTKETDQPEVSETTSRAADRLRDAAS